MESLHARSGMEIIPRKECLRLLAGHTVGRLGFVVGDQPMVLPVNYGIEGDIVVFRTDEGSKLEAALGAKVAFEIDSVDFGARSGWSVVVQGIAREITDDADWFAESLRRIAAPTWVPTAPEHYVRIDPTFISGRRIPPAASHGAGP
jgi:uncharacterized protein